MRDHLPQLFGAIVFALLALAVIIGVPEWQANRAVAPKEVAVTERPSLVNDYRRTVLQALGGLVVFGGLYLTYRRIRATEDGQITERFTNAIEQLGDDEMEVRLGGIYALERIAQDSKKDHWTIMEVLSAFVRENAGTANVISDNGKETRAGGSPETDVQAALTVIGRRKAEHDESEQQLDLQSADLQGAKLAKANLRGASLALTDLRLANLKETNLRQSSLTGAALRGAKLRKAGLREAGLLAADLREADLLEVDLREAYLVGAKMAEANIVGADLRKANLASADFREADLRVANLQGAELQAANFREANLVATDLREADLEMAVFGKADMRAAYLRDADLKEADLQEAKGLTQEQLRSAKNLDGATLDKELRDSLPDELREVTSAPGD